MGIQAMLSVLLSALLSVSVLPGVGTVPDWTPEARANMAVVLEERKASLEQAGLSYFYELYPGEHGILCVSGQYGTTHGTSTSMRYVAEDGTCVEIADLLPNSGFGAWYYLSPRDIRFRDGGKTLTFITPVQETNWQTDEFRDWGDTLCEFDTQTGTMRSMTPLG